ncbi:hypothetical protein JCM15519_07330 [Fundidesulfovibrio butyratiphilus]
MIAVDLKKIAEEERSRHNLSTYSKPSSSSSLLTPGTRIFFKAMSGTLFIHGHGPMTIDIHRLIDLFLKIPLHVIIEPDEEYWIARCPDLPLLYGTDESPYEAVEMLKREVESTYYELMGEAKMSKRLFAMFNFLSGVIASHA